MAANAITLTGTQYGTVSNYTNLSNLSTGGKYTIELWVYRNTTATNYALVSSISKSDGTAHFVELQRDTSNAAGVNFTTAYSTTPADGYKAAGPWANTTWVYTAMVFDSGGDKKTHIYYGSSATEISAYDLQRTASGTIQSSSGMNFYLAYDPNDSGSGKWVGNIGGFVRVWNVARTTTQLSANYNLNLTTANETGLIANFKFAEGSGTSIANESNGSFNMALTGTPSWTTGPTITDKNYSTTTNQTILGKSRIQITTTKTILGKSRITATATKTIQGKSRIQITTPKTIQGKARITVVTPKTITGKARVTAITGQTIKGKSRITVTTGKTITGKSRVSILTPKIIQGKSRITATTGKTIQGKAAVKDTTNKTIQGKSRITVTTGKTVTGKSRITVTTPQTIQGKSRVTVTTGKTIQGKAAVKSTTNKTIQGISRIQVTTPTTITGISRITATADKTIQGVSRITVTTAKTITGKARIATGDITTAKTITGKARILSTISKPPPTVILVDGRIAIRLAGTFYTLL